MLKTRWRNWPLLGFFVKSADARLCHNKFIKARFEEQFGCSFQVVEDFPAKPALPTKLGSYFLVPLGFGDDEPIGELALLDTLLTNDIHIIVTGNYHRLSQFDVSYFKHIHFTGYVDNDDYDKLLAESKCVICLTNDPSIQMCAAWEAVGNCKTIIFSNKTAMASLFSHVGIPAENSAHSLLCAINNFRPKDQQTLKGFCEKVVSDRRQIFQKLIGS